MSQATWDLTPLYASDTDPQIDRDLSRVSEATTAFVSKWRQRVTELDNPKTLRQALDDFERLHRDYGYSGKAGYYFHLRSAQDQNDPTIRARVTKVNDAAKQNSLKLQFFTLAIGKIDEIGQARLLKANELKPYIHFLEQVWAEARHMLDEGQEKVMAHLSTSAFSRWEEMVSALIAKAERQVLLEDGTQGLRTFSDLDTLLESKDKKVRDSAAAALNSILAEYVEIAENEINALLESKKAVDELRSYDRPDDSRHLNDDIEPSTVDSLVKTVSDNFEIAQRFYKLKAKLLGQKQLAYHERHIEYGELGGDYPYEKGVEIVRTALRKLDHEFADIFELFVKNGQLDVFPRKNKTGGAFCTYDLPTLPTYILLNHTNKISDVLTIAHEVGHGINDELVKKSQNSLNFGTSLATAEVASTFMEDFALQELMKGADDERRLAVAIMRLDRDIATIFRQIAAYRFEQELHRQYREKGYLSKEEIGKIFSNHMSSYMGTAVKQDAGSENWWVYWSHFRAFFYVYSYASGLLISKSLQASVEQDSKFIEKVKGFLSAGTSASPAQIFAKLGIDISDSAFWQRGIDKISMNIDQAEALAKKLGKI
jgi:oligoendopeptidase F